VIAMSDLGAYAALIGIAVAAGFGGGMAFAGCLAFGLNRRVDVRLQQWINAASDEIDMAASTRKQA
jgi:hypothetical protein